MLKSISMWSETTTVAAAAAVAAAALLVLFTAVAKGSPGRMPCLMMRISLSRWRIDYLVSLVLTQRTERPSEMTSAVGPSKKLLRPTRDFAPSQATQSVACPRFRALQISNGLGAMMPWHLRGVLIHWVRSATPRRSCCTSSCFGALMVSSEWLKIL